MPSNKVEPRITALLQGVSASDEVSQARASLAISLARKFDEAIDDDSATSAMATPALSKEIRATIQELMESQDDKDSLIADIFRT